MLISVIIPIYNVEKYVGECIDSVFAQDYKDLEIILVDDGSTDSSGKICDEYALKDSRVAVYHIENSGLSGARNYGTKHAHGEFIQYLDGDDCLCEGAISSSVAKITDEVDAVICRISYWCSDTDTVTEDPFTFKDEYVEGLRGDDAFANLANMATHQLWSACRPIFRRSVMTDNGFEFRDRLLSQDLDLMPHIYRKCRRIAVNNNSVIKYRTMRKGSISQVGSLKRYLDVFGIIARWDEFIRTDKESSQNFHDAMKRQIELLYVNYLKRIRYLKAEDKPAAIAAAKPLRYMLRSKNIPTKYRLTYSVFGFKAFLKAIHSV